MSSVTNSGETGERSDRRTTTLRMGVTEDEHAALYEYARKRLNMTVESFLRAAVEAYVVRWEHKSIRELTEAVKSRGKVIQGELF